MKSKSRKTGRRGTAETKVEQAVAVEAPAVRRNIDAVREVLAGRHPEMAGKINGGDADYICNVFLQNAANRAGMARALGLDAVKCSICSCPVKGEECSHFSLPLNVCRNGIIEWLGMEAVK